MQIVQFSLVEVSEEEMQSQFVIGRRRNKKTSISQGFSFAIFKLLLLRLSTFLTSDC